MYRRTFETEKHPIYPADIERCRENIRTGQQVRIKTRETDENFLKRTGYKICRVTEKHRWLFVAEDSKGRRYSTTYIDMIMQGGI